MTDLPDPTDPPSDAESSLLSAEHPGDLDMQEALSGSQAAKDWYNQAVWYTARLYVESAQEHDAVKEALLDEEAGIADPQTAMKRCDPGRHELLDDLGLSAFQGLSAEKTAARYLREEDDEEVEDGAD